MEYEEKIAEYEENIMEKVKKLKNIGKLEYILTFITLYIEKWGN